ncbi:MAG TPA: spore photoproduct lyase family protein [Terriglobales bacterium]|nr:spore photoproduct lyase family protein [Terriglobales bacterium]
MGFTGILPAASTSSVVEAPAVAPALPAWLLDISRIYLEPEVYEHRRGREVLAKFPGAELIEVPSHWKIPTLYGNEGSVDEWITNKREVLVLGVKKSLTARPNCRSSDFIAPSHSNGCAMACSYCYVPRRKGFANPISLFVNIEQIMGYLRRHAARQGVKTEPNQIDPNFWVYDIGENGDCSVDAMLSENVRDLVRLFAELPNAKASFATKYVNRALLDYDPQRKTRVRFSLMPAKVAQVVDVRTSPIADRIAAINDFWAAGYEVHLNFSPVIYYDNWLEDYRRLFDHLADVLSPEVKQQLAAEIIFLTHNDKLHQINLGWHPGGEEYLWQPELQETKYSQTGGRNLRYKRGFKADIVEQFCTLLNERLPECRIRYAF